MQHLNIRLIEQADNAELAKVIRSSLKEFGADKPGTAYYDKSTDHLYELFQHDQSVYFVALLDNQVVGGAGIYPTLGLPADTVELVKMYLQKEARGRGIARLLMKRALDAAKEKGFKKVYIETMPELATAVSFYERTGFHYLPCSMGNSGHTDCNIWMLKKL